MNKTVLIIAHECAPFNRLSSTIGAQRPYQFAKWLPEFGWNAIVITSDSLRRYSINPKKSWEDSIVDEVQNSLRTWDRTSSLTIPLPSLAFDGTPDKWWLSSVKITRNGTFIPKQGLAPSIKRKVASFLKLMTGDYSQSWQKVAEVAALTIVNEIEVSIQLACHGPDASLFVANKISQVKNIPWVVDFRDPVFQPYGRLQKPFIVKLYKRFAKSWSASINVNEVLTKIDRDHFKKNAFTITNGYDEYEFDTHITKNLLSEGNEIKFLYTGNVAYPKQKLSLFFEFLKELKTVHSNFKFFYFGNSSELIKRYAINYNVLDVIVTQDSIDRKQIPELLLSADILVIFPMQQKKGGYYVDGLLPGKFLEYLGAKKPIICISDLRTMLERTIDELEAGLVTNNLDKAIGWVLNLSMFNLPNNVKREQFSRKNTSKQLASVFKDVLTNNKD